MGKVRRRVLRREKEAAFAALVEYSTKLWRAMGAPGAVGLMGAQAEVHVVARTLCRVYSEEPADHVFGRVLEHCGWDASRPEHVIKCAYALMDYRERSEAYEEGTYNV